MWRRVFDVFHFMASGILGDELRQRNLARVLRHDGGEAMEFPLQVECGLTGRGARKPFMQMIAWPDRAAERGERRIGLDRDAAPAGEIASRSEASASCVSSTPWTLPASSSPER